jgi:hypothetical protein
MSDDDDTSHAPGATVPAAIKGWSEQDRRTLIITIAGGLAANLGTVILVGAVIALVHLSKASIGSRLASVLIGLAGGLITFVSGSYMPTPQTY